MTDVLDHASAVLAFPTTPPVAVIAPETDNVPVILVVASPHARTVVLSH
jgi:hypothetical protein